MLGGLGGFVCPVAFGALLDMTGIWTTTWMFFFAVSIMCLVWMHLVIRRMLAKHAPQVMNLMEEPVALDAKGAIDVLWQAALADGRVDTEEVDVIRAVAGALGVDEELKGHMARAGLDLPSGSEEEP